MLLLVYVHAFNLHPRYLAPMTLVEESASPATVMQYLLANGLLRFRIPLLFAISGCLFALRDEAGVSHWGRVRRRLRTLGVPYLAWSAIALAITWGFEQWPVTRGWVASAALSPFGPERAFVSDYTWREVLQRWIGIPAAFQLWFLLALLALNLLYPWISRGVTRWPRALFGVFGLLWIVGLELPVVTTAGLLFFTLGVWLARSGRDVSAPPAWFRTPEMLALWLSLAAVHTTLAFAVEQMSGPRAMGMLLLYRGIETSGLLVAWFGGRVLAERAMARPWFAWLTGSSFVIYALHVPLVNYVTEGALARVGTGPGASLAVYLLVPIGVIAMAVMVGTVLRGVVPGVYGVLTGGRGVPARVRAPLPAATIVEHPAIAAGGRTML